MSVSFHDWKNVTEKDRGFHKHESSKEHLPWYTLWKERERGIDAGKQISTLVDADQLQKNGYYVSSLIDVVGFLTETHFPLQGKIDAFDNMSEGGSSLFLSLLDYKKNPKKSY